MACAPVDFELFTSQPACWSEDFWAKEREAGQQWWPGGLWGMSSSGVGPGPGGSPEHPAQAQAACSSYSLPPTPELCVNSWLLTVRKGNGALDGF